MCGQGSDIAKAIKRIDDLATRESRMVSALTYRGVQRVIVKQDEAEGMMALIILPSYPSVLTLRSLP